MISIRSGRLDPVLGRGYDPGTLPRGSPRDENDPADPPPKRGIYRRIVTVLMASVIVYLCGVGLYSVVPQVFYPQTAEIPADLTCRDGLGRLRAELLTYSADRIRLPSDTEAAPVAAFFAEWDPRYMGLESRCASDSEAEAWELLGRLRQRVEGTLERYDREEGELARAMDSTLAGRDAR